MEGTPNATPIEINYGSPNHKTGDVNTNHIDDVDQLETGANQQLGHLANQEDHDLGRLAALKRYPWACAWCVYACWCIILVSFEMQASGSVLGIPEFRKDFGSEFDGNYVLPADWQSAFNAAPVAS